MSATHRAERLSCARMGFRPKGISGVGHTGNQRFFLHVNISLYKWPLDEHTDTYGEPQHLDMAWARYPVWVQARRTWASFARLHRDERRCWRSTFDTWLCGLTQSSYSGPSSMSVFQVVIPWHWHIRLSLERRALLQSQTVMKSWKLGYWRRRRRSWCWSFSMSRGWMSRCYRK